MILISMATTSKITEDSVILMILKATDVPLKTSRASAQTVDDVFEKVRKEPGYERLARPFFDHALAIAERSDTSMGKLINTQPNVGYTSKDVGAPFIFITEKGRSHWRSNKPDERRAKPLGQTIARPRL